MSRFFYKTQARSFNQTFGIITQKRRLHLLNQDYVLLYNFDDMSKHKYLIHNATPLWNHQSIEIRGRIYSTGGAVANTKTYLRQCQVLDEDTMSFVDLAPMKYQRDAHGICSWLDRYLICVGSWHGNGTRSCEIYDTQLNTWKDLPLLNDGTCAPGLCVINDKLFKLGGTSDIGKVEMLDLHTPKRWVTINTSNKYGRKNTINRCLMHSICPQVVERQEDEGKFLVLGCHFGRGEKPFEYNLLLNKYTQFQDRELLIDMYRSNDVVQFTGKSICIRPFVKVGEKAENVKVFQYFLDDASQFEATISREGRRHVRSVESVKRSQPLAEKALTDVHDGPRRGLNHAP